MSADELRKIRRLITELEGKVQTLADSVNTTTTDDASRTTQANEEYAAFTAGVQSTMSGCIASSIDSVKAILMENLQAYVDSKIAQAVSDILAQQSQSTTNMLSTVDQKIAQKASAVDVQAMIAQAVPQQPSATDVLSTVDQKIAQAVAKVSTDIFVQVNHQLAQVLIQQDKNGSI